MRDGTVLMAPAVEVGEFLSRLPRHGAKASLREPDGKQRDEGDVVGYAELLRELFLEHVMHRGNRGAEPDGTARKQDVLHARVDRPVGRGRLAYALLDRNRSGPIPVAADEEQHRHLMQVFGQVHHGSEHPRVWGVHSFERFDKEAEALLREVQVALLYPLLRLRVADDQELPRLRVDPARRLRSGVEHLAKELFRYRVRLQPLHRAGAAENLEDPGFAGSHDLFPVRGRQRRHCLGAVTERETNRVDGIEHQRGCV